MKSTNQTYPAILDNPKGS